MKKYIFFLLSINIITYPLTTADWNVIYAIKAGLITTSAATGGFLGYQIGSYIGRHKVATAERVGRYHAEKRYSPAPGTIETADQRAAREPLKSQYRARIHARYKRQFEQSKLNPWRLTPAAGAAGGSLGSLIANRLAIAYIARKYGVDDETARQAIIDNLDLENIKNKK